MLIHLNSEILKKMTPNLSYLTSFYIISVLLQCELIPTSVGIGGFITANIL